jgi:xanthine/CO dehydrogenase XdhC/CoxF family maturation factor
MRLGTSGSSALQSALGVVTMTMELGHEFSLAYSFHWELPISSTAQESIAAYGTDEDRIRLAGHFSATPDTLELLSEVPSPEVRLAVTNNPATPWEALARMTHDHARDVKVAANAAIEHLPDSQRNAARAMVASPMRRLRSRFSA